MYFVLEDDLSEEYLKFSNNQEYDKGTIKKLLYYYKNGFIFNLEQLEKAEEMIDGFDKNEFLTLLSDFHISVTIKELAKQTKLKLILSKDKDYFPYINISKDKLENNLGGTFYVNESREKAKEHIKAMLENAKYVVVYDNYLSDNFRSFKKFVNEIIGNNLTLECHKLRQCQIGEIKKLKTNLTVKKMQNSTKYSHDRYLLVDNKIEIILTSGIDYLMDNSKDFTYLVKFV